MYVYIITKRIELVSGDDTLNVTKKYGAKGFEILKIADNEITAKNIIDTYYNTFVSNFEKNNSLVSSIKNYHSADICYKTNETTYVIYLSIEKNEVKE